jgi:hypothetical protein
MKFFKKLLTLFFVTDKVLVMNYLKVSNAANWLYNSKSHVEEIKIMKFFLKTIDIIFCY